MSLGHGDNYCGTYNVSEKAPVKPRRDNTDKFRGRSIIEKWSDATLTKMSGKKNRTQISKKEKEENIKRLRKTKYHEWAN